MIFLTLKNKLNKMKPKYKNNTNFSQVIPADKLYFSIGEVAQLLSINASTIRFWDEELNFNLQKNARNDRRFRPEDIENLQMVIHLKEKGFNIEGIRTELKNNKIELKQRLCAIKSLNNIRDFFVMLKEELKDDNQENDNYSFERFEEKFGEKQATDLMIQSSTSYTNNYVDIVDTDDAQMYSPEYLEEYQQDLVEESNEEK